ncbi:monocyte to macrophage differentiation factor 2 [Teleopsis dalmanni]|uniref:monocyte to macrophage differentiation factor 2 n=1 Tax=Teleopsis dalmanni TaxID=139649 RepID=UPI0018CD11AB|nr:monocyte to macrophage differentiation factor 2 [Teleopsis dalmanni]
MSNIAKEVQNKYSFLNNILTSFWRTWIKSNSSFKAHIKSVNWKNEKPKTGYAYKPTEVEQLANVLTHGFCIVPSIIAALKLFERSKTPNQYLVSWVYGGALSMLFTISTFFHCSCYSQQKNGLKNILHRCDRAMIYIFIAGSYFPWLQLGNIVHSALVCMEWLIWLLAAIGITYQQIFHERYKCLETCCYVLMGLGPALAVLLTGNEFNGLTELKLGGFFYILGICFFKCDGIIPMAHAIWHLFVVLAAGFHYYAIIINLFPVN